MPTKMDDPGTNAYAEMRYKYYKYYCDQYYHAEINRRRKLAALAVSLVSLQMLATNQRRRTIWSRNWLLRRNENLRGLGVLNMLFDELG